ncbi:hypothetical protein BGX21_009151, partial [Mortierella sp. AD011]
QQQYQQHQHQPQPTPSHGPNPSSNYSSNSYRQSTYSNDRPSVATPQPTSQNKSSASTSASNSTPDPIPRSTSTSARRPTPSSQPTPFTQPEMQAHSQPRSSSPLPTSRRAPQDRNDHSPFTSQSNPESTASNRDAPPISRPGRLPRAPQEEENTSLLTLQDIMSSNEDLSLLPNRVIKMLLDTNCVNYVGVIERDELVDRLAKLIENTRLSQAKFNAEQDTTTKPQNEPPTSKKSPTTSTSFDEGDNTCKICFEAPLNCVMLNCGHLSSCMDW